MQTCRYITTLSYWASSPFQLLIAWDFQFGCGLLRVNLLAQGSFTASCLWPHWWRGSLFTCFLPTCPSPLASRIALRAASDMATLRPLLVSMGLCFVSSGRCWLRSTFDWLILPHLTLWPVFRLPPTAFSHSCLNHCRYADIQLAPRLYAESTWGICAHVPFVKQMWRAHYYCYCNGVEVLKESVVHFAQETLIIATSWRSLIALSCSSWYGDGSRWR